MAAWRSGGVHSDGNTNKQIVLGGLHLGQSIADQTPATRFPAGWWQPQDRLQVEKQTKTQRKGKPEDSSHPSCLIIPELVAAVVILQH